MGIGEAGPERARATSAELEIGERLEKYREARESDVERLRGHDAKETKDAKLENADLRQRARDRALFRSQSDARQQQRLEAIGTLASGVAHEINNPVQSIMNYALLIERRSGTPEVVKYAQEILHEAQRVAAIVRGLLSFARQEGGPYTDVAVHELVSGTLSLLSVMMRKDGVHIDANDLEDGPAVRCHPQQIQQVLMNLLANARDALNERYPAADDGKRIILHSRSWLRDGELFVRLTVEDFGVGIGPALLEKIFDPFFSTKAQGQAAGLGLAISHGIVVEHGGMISVESDSSSTRFHVDLPAASVARAAIREVV